LDSIPLTDASGLRDRALIAVMVFSFARVSAAVGLRVRDYFPEGKRWRLRLHEKGGKEHVVPCHHVAEEYLDQYLNAVGIPQDTNASLFRTIDPRGATTSHGMTRNDAFRMVKRRVRAAGLPGSVGCHTFRATGITAYLSNGGTIENAQAIAAHESPRTTKLYDRRQDAISLDEIERIVI
jgi:integrase